MQVGQFITKLTNTTLRNLGVTKDVTSRELNPEYRAEIIDYINSGLMELYNKYQLKVDFLFLETQLGRTKYPLTSEHVMDNWHEPSYDKYLWKDSDPSFTEDIVKILLVRDHSGIEIPLNDPNDVLSVFTPEYNVLELPSHFPEQIITVDYQARHKPVREDIDEIELPVALLDPLSFYVASMAHSNMDGQTSVANAQKYAQLFSNAIQTFDELGTFQPKHTPTYRKFYLGGWV